MLYSELEDQKHNLYLAPTKSFVFTKAFSLSLFYWCPFSFRPYKYYITTRPAQLTLIKHIFRFEQLAVFVYSFNVISLLFAVWLRTITILVLSDKVNIDLSKQFFQSALEVKKIANFNFFEEEFKMASTSESQDMVILNRNVLLQFTSKCVCELLAFALGIWIPD